MKEHSGFDYLVLCLFAVQKVHKVQNAVSNFSDHVCAKHSLVPNQTHVYSIANRLTRQIREKRDNVYQHVLLVYFLLSSFCTFGTALPIHAIKLNPIFPQSLLKYTAIET